RGASTGCTHCGHSGTFYLDEPGTHWGNGWYRSGARTRNGATKTNRGDSARMAHWPAFGIAPGLYPRMVEPLCVLSAVEEDLCPGVHALSRSRHSYLKDV